MTFKVLSLGLALLLGAAWAQSPAIPALPLAPVTAAPVPAPPAPASAVALRLSALPGTALEYATSVELKLSEFEIKFVARPGAELSAADSARLTELNRALSAQQAGVGQLLGNFAQSLGGKQFLKVLPSDAQGNSVLLSTVVAPPLRLGAGAGAGVGAPPPETRSLQLVQLSAPDGRPLGLKVQGTDPAPGEAAALSADALTGGLGQSNLSLYGLSLAPGETRGSTQTVDLSALLGPLAEALGGQNLGAQIAAQPLTLNVATTFLGLGSGGVLRYQQRFVASPWTLSLDLPGQDGASRITMQVDNWSAQGGLSYRADGLPQTGDSAQTVALSLTVDRADGPLQLQARLGFSVVVSSAPR
ncbi:hypothetical protein DKM44_14460 [Deinococcus irradiatisoli]|uniref:Uncharacterized protein n=1 Tax=Deinococcus irradiatisoli TaxID=2202254 RepID=A0A2Z3JH13_9DEIO|nr:hypothetical protein [Deinococcus irradiatisoli]AWN24282.1 hypothetical protein DKM44_14460 [Deinococcus irradiatisoli]